MIFLGTSTCPKQVKMAFGLVKISLYTYAIYRKVAKISNWRNWYKISCRPLICSLQLSLKIMNYIYCDLGPLLQTQIKETSAKFRCWINNYIHIKLWAVNIHPCPNFNDSFMKPPLKPEHGCVITFHRNQCMWLLIHVLISSLHHVGC